MSVKIYHGLVNASQASNQPSKMLNQQGEAAKTKAPAEAYTSRNALNSSTVQIAARAANSEAAIANLRTVAKNTSGEAPLRSLAEADSLSRKVADKIRERAKDSIMTASHEGLFVYGKSSSDRSGLLY